MARISSYNLDDVIRPDDLLIGSSYEGSFNGQPIYKTRNYKLEKLAEFFIGYDFNAGLSLTTLEGIVDGLVVDVSDLDSALTALTNRVAVNEGDISTLQSSVSINSSKVQYLTLSSDSSIFMGSGAGENDNGTNNSNIGIGVMALREAVDASTNIAIGDNSLDALVNAGNGNIAIGKNVLTDATTSYNNIAIGLSSLLSATNSSYNSTLGVSSLNRLTTGGSNIAIGYRSNYDLTSGSNNITIGYSADDKQTPSGTARNSSDSIVIGNNSKTASDSSLPEIVIGNGIIGDGNNTFKAGNENLSSFKFGRLRNSISLLNNDRTVIWPNKGGTVAMLDDLPTTAQKSNWDTAYNDSVIGISVTPANPSGSVKTIELVRRSSTNLEASFTDIFETGSGGIIDTNYYLTGATFNPAEGELTLSVLDQTPIIVSTFDDRYYTEDEVDAFITGLGDTYYTETEVDTLLTGYLQPSSIDTISELQTLVADATIWHSGNDSVFPKLASNNTFTGTNTFSGIVTVNEITDVDSISFSPSSDLVNANNIMTWLPRDHSILTRGVSEGLNWPEPNVSGLSYGQQLTVRGGTSEGSGTQGGRTFSFFRRRDQNTLHYGTLGANATNPVWTWNEVAHENVTNFSFKQDISFDNDIYLDTTSKIYFGFGTEQQEELSAATISATTNAFNSVIVGGTTGSTITFTRLSGLAEDQYSITDIARLNSPNNFTGALTAPDFILSSDVSLKENIENYNVSPININYKTYNLIDDKDKNTRVGVIAQDLEHNHPEFVREDENGVKSVSYIDLLMAKIAELEHRINYLENGGYTG